MDKDICITNCYTEDKGNFAIFHPFLGIISINDPTNNYCVKKNFNDNLIKKCTQEDSVNITIHSSLLNPIKKNNYLKNYYNLNSIDDIIKYINGNNLLFSTKNRLLDFTFITYYDTIEQNIDKWIELIKTLFDEYKLTDLNTTKVIKKIKNKFNNNNDYPINLLIKIKKYLDNNI
jgi:cobalamin biosynthesis Co2+ chelatase CbiK